MTSSINQGVDSRVDVAQPQKHRNHERWEMQGIRREEQRIDQFVDEEGQPAEEKGGNDEAENARRVAGGTIWSQGLRGGKESFFQSWGVLGYLISSWNRYNKIIKANI